jgi:hypothetical protein
MYQMVVHRTSLDDGRAPPAEEHYLFFLPSDVSHLLNKMVAASQLNG